MHIAIYHDAVIPPKKYGGTERVIFWLAKALISLGHRVTLIAQEGSDVPGADLKTVPNSSNLSWQDLIPEDADLVHLWSTPGCPPRKPYLVTIEGNGRLGENFYSNTVFVSRRHAQNHGSKYFVYNGIDPLDFPCDEERENYVVFLAKASWKVKNLTGALEVARAADIPIRVMGNKGWPPRLNLRLLPRWKNVTYCGMVGDLEKREILRKAKALLFPVRWHEPFGIAITEALASGCPVFGTPYGSLPEIITPETGVLSTQAEELFSSLKRLNFSPSTCRERVYQGFTHVQMAQSYLKYYEEVLSRGSLDQRSENLQFQLEHPPETLLPWFSLNKGPRKA